MLVLVALSNETLQLANGNAKNKQKRANYSGSFKDRWLFVKSGEYWEGGEGEGFVRKMTSIVREWSTEIP